MGNQGNTSIYDIVNTLERLRKNAFWSYFLLLLEVIVYFGIIIYLDFKISLSETFLDASIWIFFIIFIITFGFCSSLKKKFRIYYKQVFVESMLGEFFDQPSYSFNSGFTRDQVKDFSLVQMGNRFSSEDLIQASYKGVKFSQADVSVRHHTGSGKSSHTTTYFNGRMFIFEIPKYNNSLIQIFSKGFHYQAGSDEHGKTQIVEMEDMQFNDCYSVRASNEHDAFYILTPQVILRMNKMRLFYNDIAFAYENGRLCVACDNMLDSFEPRLSHSVSYPEESKRMKEQVQIIINLMEMMGLVPSENEGSVE